MFNQEFFATCINIASKYHTSLLLGVRVTITVALTGTIIGLVLGLLIGGTRAIKLDIQASSVSKTIKKVYDTIATIYIEVFRGTPMMVQGAFIYYALLHVFNWTPNVAGVFVISINTGAYMSEIIRGGIQSVDVGQVEAARSLGMSSMQTMFTVVLPQAIKNAFPAIGNEFIVNIKDSSVLSIISMTDLMYQSSRIAGSTYHFTESYFVAACVYLVLTLTCSIILRNIEKHMSKVSTSLPQSDTTTESQKIAPKSESVPPKRRKNE